MNWRCTWCGKPHEDNDPPCDACGHGQFEEAIVRVQEYDTVDTGTTYVWRCPNCGREHVKNSPPCSRCGNPELDKVEQTYEDVERDLDVPSWFEVARPYLPAITVIVVVLSLFAAGIVPLSILPGIETGPPSPPGAPGEADEADGLDLSVVEMEVYDRLDAERERAGGPSVATDDGLASLAEYLNRMLVAERYDGESVGPPDVGAYDTTCATDDISHLPATVGTIDEYDTEVDLADAIVDRLSSELTETTIDSEGIDVHVGPDGDVYVSYVFC